MDWKIEVITVPVIDVVQVTPPGSACSITLGVNVGGGEPGSVKGIHICVNDIEARIAWISQRIARMFENCQWQLRG
jgi:hypothetical protein